MKTLWVLLANSSSAYVYEIKANGKELREIAYFDYPDGKKKAKDLISDRPGRTFDRIGMGRHSLAEDVDIHTQEMHIFADQLINFLKRARSTHEFEELAFIAPPQFLGELNQRLPAAIKKQVIKEINKDIPSYRSPEERIESIYQYLDLPYSPA